MAAFFPSCVHGHLPYGTECPHCKARESITRSTRDTTPRPDCAKHLERLTQWARDTGFATGHADSTEQLLEEVGEQVEALRAKYRETLVPVSALQPLCSRYIGDPEYRAEDLFHDLQTLILDAEREANGE